MGRFALIIVVGFAVITGGLKMNHGRLARNAQNVANDRFIQVTSRNITNTTVNMCLYQVAQNFNWRTGYNGASILNGSADALIEDSSDDTTISYNEIRITATGTYGKETSTAVVLMSKSAFSQFAYFTDVEPWIWFITGDTLMGPIHTNGQFHIWGDPVFYGLVSSVATSYYGSGNPEFKAGTNFGTQNIQLPVDLSIIEGKAQLGGTYFEGETEVEFNSDGTFDWSVSHPETTWVGSPPVMQVNIVVDSTGNTDISSTNGVIASADGYDLHVEGTLDGQVTMLSGADLWIEDDILYLEDPLTNPDADDLLGLISKQDTWVANNAANQDNCVINATIMALGDSFGAEAYNQGSPRGELNILGGIVQNIRGPVGTFGSGGIQTGYRKKYVYDQRFLTAAPPFYPVFSQNTVVSWYE